MLRRSAIRPSLQAGVQARLQSYVHMHYIIQARTQCRGTAAASWAYLLHSTLFVLERYQSIVIDYKGQEHARTISNIVWFWFGMDKLFRSSAHMATSKVAPSSLFSKERARVGMLTRHLDQELVKAAAHIATECATPQDIDEQVIEVNLIVRLVAIESKVRAVNWCIYRRQHTTRRCRLAWTSLDGTNTLSVHALG